MGRRFSMSGRGISPLRVANAGDMLEHSSQLDSAIPQILRSQTVTPGKSVMKLHPSHHQGGTRCRTPVTILPDREAYNGIESILLRRVPRDYYAIYLAHLARRPATPLMASSQKTCVHRPRIAQSEDPLRE